ncbi:MAG: hypothetical protein K1X28_04930 [Parachlamydiales bacterium]|nr:hypothetical protein [Parachlamydiales bacterium]
MKLKISIGTLLLVLLNFLFALPKEGTVASGNLNISAGSPTTFTTIPSITVFFVAGVYSPYLNLVSYVYFLDDLADQLIAKRREDIMLWIPNKGGRR